MGVCLSGAVAGRFTDGINLLSTTFVHPTAEVSGLARLGEGVRIWNWTKVREHASIGERSQLGQCCFVDTGVQLGAGCKVQNGVSIYRGVTVGDDVFIGPNVTFTNDLVP